MIRIFILFIQLWVQVQLQNDSLVLVHVILRHCDRTPDKGELYQKSPYYSESNFAPYGYGQLTNVGKRKCYEIGTALRRRYNDFLNSSYHYSLVEGRSSDYQRTKESLQLVLAGLFPPTEELTWLNGMNWIPIATVYEKKEKDKELYPFGNKKYTKELQNFEKTNEAQAIAASYKDLTEHFSRHIEEPVDFRWLCYLTRGMVIMNALGFNSPEWLNSTLFNRAKESLQGYFTYATASQKLKRIFGGYLLKKLVDSTEMKLNGSLKHRNRKMFIYGAHGYNINILYKILDLWNVALSPFGSYCIFEVHHIDGKYGFKLFNYNYTTDEPQPVSIPGFGEFAPLDDFKIQKREFLELDDLEEL